MKDNENQVVNYELGLAKEILEIYMESGMTIDDFCSRYNFTTKRIEKYAEMVKNEDPLLYQNYLSKVEYFQKLKDEYIKSELMKLAFYLKNGIDVNGIHRNFELVDFFCYIDLDFKKLLTYINLLEDGEEKNSIRSFRCRNSKYGYHIPAIGRKILKTEFIFPSKFDQEGNLISEGCKLTEEQREQVLNYLDSKNVPFNEYTLCTAMRLFAYNMLNIEVEDKSLSK